MQEEFWHIEGIVLLGHVLHHHQLCLLYGVCFVTRGWDCSFDMLTHCTGAVKGEEQQHH